MLSTIKQKLIFGFLAVVAVFMLACTVSLYEMQHVGAQSSRFITEYWPTADLIMETRIEYGEIYRIVMDPPVEVDFAGVRKDIEDHLSILRERFADTQLSEKERQRIDTLLGDVKNRFPAPLALARIPGEKMKVADAAVQPVVADARKIRNLDLIDALHEAVMAFNDFLITQDSDEKELFEEQTGLIENDPAFSAIASRYWDFKAAALDVFRSADELAVARTRFTEAGEVLSGALKELEGRYHQEVVNPAAERIARGVKTALWVLVTAVAGSAALSLVIAYRTSVGISRPVGAVIGVIKGMAKGRLDMRLGMKRRDEIGLMAGAMDEMGDNLDRMVRRIGASAAELGKTSLDVGSVSENLGACAREQVRGIGMASEAVQKILLSSQESAHAMEVLHRAAAHSAESLEEISRQISETAASADHLGAAAGAVEKSVESLTASVEQIAGSAEELKSTAYGAATSVTQMEAATRQVEVNARETLRIVEEVRRDGEQGRSAVEANIGGMGEIRRASQATAEIIQSLVARIGHIGNVLSMIEEISEQVDLLALNAAIIAAQSGEHGRGFAVVAEEIKELSMRTRDATTKIGIDVQAVREESARAVAAIGQADKSISLGVEVSRQSGEALDKIVSGVGGATGQMQRIANAVLEQSEGIRVIRDTIERVVGMVDKVVSVTADQTRESGSIAEAVHEVRFLGEALRKTTREQSLAGKNIANSAQEIGETVEEVRRACFEQIEKCTEIVRAVTDIEKGAGLNLTHAGELKGCLERLTQTVEALREETGAFTTTTGAG